MKKFESYLFPILLIVVGLIILSGINVFGAAFFEGATWKQNVIFTLMILFGMLPPSVREQRFTWMVIGGAIVFFYYGGANILGTVGKALIYTKILLATLMAFLGYRLWSTTWSVNKLYMIVPVLGLIFIGLLFPIKDQNIFGSGFEAIKNWSAARFTSDKGFHIYLGLVSILAGIGEILIQRKSPVDSHALVESTQCPEKDNIE